jgi:hypothetical protein
VTANGLSDKFKRDTPFPAVLPLPRVSSSSEAASFVAKLNNAVRQIIKSPQIKEQFARSALLTEDLDVSDVTKFIANEVALWGSLAKQAGLKVQ